MEGVGNCPHSCMRRFWRTFWRWRSFFQYHQNLASGCPYQLLLDTDQDNRGHPRIFYIHVHMCVVYIPQRWLHIIRFDQPTPRTASPLPLLTLLTQKPPIFSTSENETDVWANYFRANTMQFPPCVYVRLSPESTPRAYRIPNNGSDRFWHLRPSVDIFYSSNIAICENCLTDSIYMGICLKSSKIMILSNYFKFSHLVDRNLERSWNTKQRLRI